jgi:hypothetical protein
MGYLADQGAISREDLSLVLLTDSVAEAMQHIDSFLKLNYPAPPRKRKWWLFERKPTVSTS